jgi:ribosomal protein S27AE
MQPADNLMLSGVRAFCPDCAEETIFVAPETGDAGDGDHACTRCGAAVLLDLIDAAPGARVARSA